MEFLDPRSALSEMNMENLAIIYKINVSMVRVSLFVRTQSRNWSYVRRFRSACEKTSRQQVF